MPFMQAPEAPEAPPQRTTNFQHSGYALRSSKQLLCTKQASHLCAWWLLTVLRICLQASTRLGEQLGKTCERCGTALYALLHLEFLQAYGLRLTLTHVAGSF